jgi:ABC-type dipeptide/oligopeptide/nickel transport system permease component
VFGIISYLSKLALRVAITIWAVATLTFFATRLVPGNPAYALLGSDATAARVHQVEVRLGLNHPLLVQYWDFIKGLPQGELGQSMTNDRSVSSLIWAVLPYTLELGVAAVLIGILLGNLFGVVAAAFHDRAPDFVIRIVSLLLLSFPGFYLGVLIIFLVALPLHMPTNGAAPFSDIGENLYRLLLPALSLGLIGVAFQARVTRSIVLETLGEDHIRTARANGVGNWGVMLRHALQPAAVPLVPLIGLYFIVVIGGSVLTEQVFARPGIGQVLLSAINGRDYNVVQGVVIVYAIIVVIGTTLIDIAYRLVDPRVRHTS